MNRLPLAFNVAKSASGQLIGD
ncbi:MAG: hypothetical protein RIS79_3220, partial [Verrucomicrobiota bacterium]